MISPFHDRPGPVVVGVDGSVAAMNTVRWACVEAHARDTVLRLVHAVETRVPDVDPVLIHAQRTAAAALGAAHRVEAESIVGSPGEVLLDESADSVMVCIGARHVAGSVPVGTIAAMLARAASCPIAVIRSRQDGTPRTDGVISVVLSDEDGNDDLIHLAMYEGRLRHATVRQIDTRVESWIRRYPDVHVETVAAGTGHQYRRCESFDTDVGLAVVGSEDAAGLASVRIPNCHPIPDYPRCSLLLVRG